MDEDPLPVTEETTGSFSLKSNDGLSLNGQTWLPPDIPSANMILIHSLGEHSGCYDHVARYFRQRNYAVYAVDLRGHGRSEGQRGHIEQFEDYLEDVRTLIAYIQAEAATGPLFLIGHSMGGLIALMYALKYRDDIAAVIASSPALRSKAQKIPGWRLFLTNLMSTVNPGRTIQNKLDPSSLSHEVDPLIHDQFTARWFTEVVRAAEWTMENANSLAVPALILQGGSDQVVDPASAREFFDRIGLEDKYYVEYETLPHNIFEGPEAQSVLGDIEAWLIPRLQPQVGILPLAS